MEQAKSNGRWEKLPPLPGRPNPCLNCPPIAPLLDLDRPIAVGFGYAGLLRDGLGVWEEQQCDDEEPMTVAQAEAMAAADPDHDWRIALHGPMHGEVYQRHGQNEWVLVEKDEGFA